MADDTGNASRKARGLVASTQYELRYFVRKHDIPTQKAREILRQAGKDRFLANKLATAELQRARSVAPEEIANKGRYRSFQGNGKKRALSVRVDDEVAVYFLATGDDWQDRVNDALRKAAGLSDGSGESDY